LFNNKFEAIFKVVYGVDIVVSQPHSRDNDTMEAKEDSSSSLDTQSNPIFIEEDPLLTQTELIYIKRVVSKQQHQKVYIRGHIVK
jgi:hypothetical protein